MSHNNCGCNEQIETNLCPPASPCICSTLISSDCVTTFTEDLPCSSIVKGQTLNETFLALDAYICERFGSVENFLKIVNVGTGAGVYKGISNIGEKEFKTLLGSSLVTLTQGANEITISVNETALTNIITQVALTDQNNFVRDLIIDVNSLPDPYDEQDICDYILALSASSRTILPTDSKWNIIIAAISS